MAQTDHSKLEKPYSKPTEKDLPQHVLWGDTHLHTSNSFDSGLLGNRLGPEDAFQIPPRKPLFNVPGRNRRPKCFTWRHYRQRTRPRPGRRPFD